ncbi:MAG: hypothetical protein ABIE70_12435 [bacterium]
MSIESEVPRDISVIGQVDELSEEVKILALNLAIYLAKAKPGSKELDKMEPEFIRLVNGTVRVVQQIARIIAAARNGESLIYTPPSGDLHRDQIEVRLRAILDQCGRIMSSLSRSEDFTA